MLKTWTSAAAAAAAVAITLAAVSIQVVRCVASRIDIYMSSLRMSICGNDPVGTVDADNI